MGIGLIESLSHFLKGLLPILMGWRIALFGPRPLSLHNVSLRMVARVRDPSGC